MSIKLKTNTERMRTPIKSIFIILGLAIIINGVAWRFNKYVYECIYGWHVFILILIMMLFVMFFKIEREGD